MARTILHCDLNSFYASVECLYRPDIRHLPVAVCGSVENRHGIVLAKNNIAKGARVSTGEAIWQAKQKCPGLVVVPPNYPLYLRFSKEARKIYEHYTDKVEAFGIDECWLDVTRSTALFGSGESIAQQIRQRMKSELGITVSIGVSWNKIFAKLGSDYQKPDAITVIDRENYQHLVLPLAAGELLYVGRSTNTKLAKRGILTIGDIAEAGPERLKRILGKWGEVLWRFASGLDCSEVSNVGMEAAIKSIGNSFTTKADLECNEDVKHALQILSESVGRRLRENHFKCTVVQIYIRDNLLQSCEVQGKLDMPSFLSCELAEKSMQLFEKKWAWHRNIRSLGVRACELICAEDMSQLSFFVDMKKRIKMEQLEVCIDDIRRRFGHFSVQRASLINDKKSGKEDPQTHIIHPISFFR